MNILKFQHK